MSPETKLFLDFGDFRLDRAEKVLSREGKTIALTPKVFDTLEVLLANPGHLLSKDELISKIWPDHFVEESNLTFNIKMLRRALGDDAESPRFIQTVPRRGYRFIAEVRETVEDDRNGSPPIETTRSGRRSYLPLAIIIVLSLGTIGFASWFVRKEFYGSGSVVPILSRPFHVEKFSNSGKVSHAAMSPDGKLVAFVDETGGRNGVWLRHLDTSENIQIIPISDDLYFGLAFAQDGNTLYFVRSRRTGTTNADIYRVSIYGGVPEKIVEHAEGWISISPDDRQISFVRCKYQDDDYCSLFVANTDGRSEKKILTTAIPVRITDNQFSPNGGSIAFATGESINGSTDFRLMKVDLVSSAESELSPSKFFEVTSLKWLPDGRTLLAAARETLDGKANIWQISAETGEALPLTKDAADYREISLNKEASEMVSRQLGDNFKLFLSATGGSTKTLTAARDAVFAPDGKIVYSTDDGDIWTINREGSEQRQLTSSIYREFRPYVAADGRFIYFTSNRTGTNQIWRMDGDGSNQIQITKTEGGYTVFVSPDTKWVYYESGLHKTFWKVSTENGEEIQVSDRKLYRPAFSPDGKFVAYFFHDQEIGDHRKIAVMAIANNEIVKTLNFAEPESSAIQIAWSGDGRNIDYVTGSAGKNTLWRQSIDESARTLIAELGDKEVAHFALAADDDAYLYTRGEWLHDAVLVDGLR